MSEHTDHESRPINRRNTLIVLGAIGAILLVSNIDGPSFDFDSDESRSSDVQSREDRIEAAAERLEARIEAKVERDLESKLDEIDDREMEAAIEDLKEGDPDRFLELMERY
jgi:hypothetical protein